MKSRIFFAVALLVAAPAFAQQAAKPAAQPGLQGGPDATFAAWDKDGNGTLTKDEFRAGWMATRDDLALRRLQTEFARHDTDKSGKLEAGEYAQLALVLRAGKSAPAMTAFDKNKDGGLQFAEYIDFIKVAGAQQPRAVAPATPKAK
ncbi:EF-hand domain-containing protein [Lysobacter sp. 2RAF19]